MKRLLLPLLYVLIISNSLNAQWSVVHPILSNINLEKIITIDKNNFFVLSANRLFKITEDTNKSTEINLSDLLSEKIANIFFIDLQTGWVLGQTGQVLKTTDGGNNWISYHIGLNLEFHSIYFTDNVTGFAVGYYGIIVKTTDGGKTWIQKNSNTTNRLRTIFFLDQNEGWAAGNNSTVLHTTNSGEYWEIFSTGENYDITKIRFITKNFGWYNSVNTFAVTQDGGKSWQKKVLSFSVGSTWFFNVNEGILISNRLNYTNNGGITFKELRVPTFGGCNDISMVNSEIGFIVGQGGTILKTKDGGKNWESLALDQRMHFSRIKFFDLETGYASIYVDMLLKTCDGGRTWISILNSTHKDFYLIDKNTVFVLTDSKLLKTTNGGISWENAFSRSGYILTALSIYDNGIFLIAVTNGYQKLFSSGDLGKSWKETGFDISPSIYTIFYLDAQNAWLFGVGIVYNTDNGGITWRKISTNAANDAKNSYFIDKLHGWIWNYNSVYFKTTDGGVSWIKEQFSEETLAINSIHFINNKVGWACGREGKLIKTTDGGSSWVKLNFDHKNDLNTVFFINSFTGWIGGSNGSIFVNSTGGNMFPDDKNPMFSNHKLYQNYPNPFNTSCIIYYQIIQPEFVTLKVYDMLGREVATLVNEEKLPGIYNIKFDASHSERSRGIASGIYIYQIKAGGFTEARKMILLK